MKKFSYQYYAHILERCRAEGYRVSSFADFDPSTPKTIILRHDVDYTLDGVAALAEMESAAGVTASYLFRVHAHEYNLFAPTTFVLVRKLKALGHEIGLHFEAGSIGRALGMPAAELLVREKRTIETILGQEILTASEHRDFSHVVHDTPALDQSLDIYAFGFKFYAMDPRYAKDMKYLSDSNANWREGDLLDHLGKFDRYQILIHPDWWFESDLLLKGKYAHGIGNGG
jgi:hypothetical protein